jgi:hypothetical protein
MAARAPRRVPRAIRRCFRTLAYATWRWRAARADEAREALLQLDPLWDELFPAEQARIVQLLVQRVDVRMHGVDVRLRPNGLAGLVREVTGSRRAAA